MAAPPPPWSLTLARIEGALSFAPPAIHAMLALRSLRRLWALHVRDYPFENVGPDHDPGPEARELVRSWFTEERAAFLSWISRRGPPPLADAALLALRAKDAAERFSSAYDDAERALARIDALLPSSDPLASLLGLVKALREDELAFLEGGSETHLVAGHALDRPAPKGAAWAASLALAMRPQLFGLGAAPLALAGALPRTLFRPSPEEPLPRLLDTALTQASSAIASDLADIQQQLAHGTERLAELYASSRAPDAWQLLVGLGPLTRAELARALQVTARTASQAAVALERLGLVVRAADGVLRVER